MDALKNKTWDKAGRGNEEEKSGERGENIKEQGREREREEEERQLERGARRSPACCQVPGFPSPFHKRLELGEGEGGGGVKRGEGSIHKKPCAPLSLEPFTPPPQLQWQQLESAIIPSSAI